jgi:hypothetical protein
LQNTRLVRPFFRSLQGCCELGIEIKEKGIFLGRGCTEEL